MAADEIVVTVSTLPDGSIALESSIGYGSQVHDLLIEALAFNKRKWARSDELNQKVSSAIFDAEVFERVEDWQKVRDLELALAAEAATEAERQVAQRGVSEAERRIQELKEPRDCLIDAPSESAPDSPGGSPSTP